MSQCSYCGKSSMPQGMKNKGPSSGITSAQGSGPIAKPKAPKPAPKMSKKGK